MANRDTLTVDQLDANPPAPRGKNHLLAIAINDYAHCTPLNNAVFDVEAFIQVLLKRYHFEENHITFLKDTEASKRNIERAFDRLIDRIEPADSLIVYFSGHGRYHPRRGGFWLPVEAGQGDDDWTDYLSNSLVKEYLSKIDCFHTFLIADSCFSGALFIDKSKEKFSGDRRDTEKSRWGLTSGKKEIVSDGVPGEHSPFSTALLDVLEKADQPLGVMRICDLVLEKVAANAQQTPMGSPLLVPGHQGGQMVLYFRQDEEQDWLAMGSSVEGCKTYLRQYPNGKYQFLANQVITKDREEQAWTKAKAAGSKFALLDFERNYPDSEPVRSGQLDRLIGSMDEEELWANAQRSNTVSAYRNYLIRSIIKKYEREAAAAIEAIAQQEREPAAWAAAKQANTVKAYEQYLLDYPQGVYHTEAKKTILALEAEKRKIAELDKTQKEDAFAHDQPKEVNKTEEFHKVLGNWVKRNPALSIVGMVLVIGFILIQSWPEKKAPSKEVLGLISSIDQNMKLIPGGKFKMGSNETNAQTDEKPVHEVILNDFYLGKTEVTQEQWRAVMGNDPPELGFKGCDQCPVENVSWDNVQQFIQKLNAQTGKNYRLPTEAEWEYAARGGAISQDFTYAGSNNLDEVAWYDSNSGIKTHPVAQKKANELGLYDMSGNVYEWCQDWYDAEYYQKSPANNPQGPNTGSLRVNRGGSWSSRPIYARVAYRRLDSPGLRDSYLGFRLARQQ
ncbi:SUMF1/EgtB/PvdO family nonheme iron enzyme [Haliscomenobacter hydrossis]|uniref:Sulphatase-modifying factor protein n=1 Tax=Haliscomenobacter hydrossis (strain ATCC 27775 / DSM 1100 / LMG 10767 / O) TaxID=760192 RepID=F4KRQ3_HALH1|nr:SUMF1/EgtB/PvdO family nonheme iron enzyme [Haliscomenobacter hydrossis]AEE50007.1 Sulphatase-modifying factor protein [Haliscomenobacter hydrossis DSM 1100]